MFSTNNKNRARHWLALMLTIVYSASTVAIVLERGTRASAQAITPNWSYTGSLNTGRGGHTATLLANGKVLVVGGSYDAPRSAELYDPVTGTWSTTGSLNLARFRHTATLLANGKVLVTGGFLAGAGAFGSLSSATKTAELYDPATGAWTPVRNMNSSRASHSATLLRDGKVLVVGGLQEAGYIFYTSGLNSAELYDPEADTWTTTGSLKTGSGHVAHTATLLQTGKVLVAGGSDSIYDPGTVDEEIDDDPLAGAELYDPNTGSWSVTGSLDTPRVLHTATLLPNGDVLVVGGGDSPGGVVVNMASTSEVYSPTTGKWSYAGTPHPRVYHTATLLRNGQVLVVGGANYQADLKSAEIYDPATRSWSSTASLNVPRSEHTATLLFNGKVLVAGGDAVYPPRSAELCDSGVNSTTNPIDDAQFFVTEHYRDFLSREPDSGGLAFWTNEIMSCSGDAQCIEEKRINVSAAYFLSIEFQQTGYLVYRTYKAAYGNLPDGPVPIRFSEFLPDTKEIGQGVIVNQPGWDQVLETNKQAFMSEFMQRDRFTSAFPATMSADQFVDALNQNAGNPLSQTERDSLVSDLSSGVKTRADVLRAIAENQNLVDAEFNRAFVLMQYFGYLRRDPNQGPDTDFGGYNFWLNKLDTFHGDFIQAEMVKAFIDSAEYRQRFVQ